VKRFLVGVVVQGAVILMLVLFTFMLVLLTFGIWGCGRNWSPVAAESPQELFALAETARFSGIAGQRVRGEISTTFYEVKCPDGSPCHAYGWYVGDYGKGAKGVAYFYQKDVNKSGAESSITYAAAHEVAHSVTGPAHDTRHAACMAELVAGRRCE
jgi:hypothetical protein